VTNLILSGVGVEIKHQISGLAERWSFTAGPRALHCHRLLTATLGFVAPTEVLRKPSPRFHMRSLTMVALYTLQFADDNGGQVCMDLGSRHAKLMQRQLCTRVLISSSPMVSVRFIYKIARQMIKMNDFSTSDQCSFETLCHAWHLRYFTHLVM